MDLFAPEQTRFILDSIGVDVVSETPSHWMCLCPFHHNTDTPAMVVDKEEGVYLCNNAACGRTGPIRKMIQDITGKNIFQTEVLVLNAQKGSKFNTVEYIKRQVTPETLPEYPMDRLVNAHDAFWENKDAVQYMTKDRKFDKETLKEFMIGYVHLPVTEKRKVEEFLVIVPMFDKDGKPIGYVGRGLYDKSFHNSYKLPKQHSLWNIHKAKRAGTTVITESSFDAMRTWQATGVHAVATLGSSLGQGQAEQLSRYFTHIISAPDDDKDLEFKSNCVRCRQRGHDICVGHNTGFELGLKIVERTEGPRVSWAHLDSLKRFDGNKDFGDLTDEQIRYAVDHAVSNYEIMRRM